MYSSVDWSTIVMWIYPQLYVLRVHKFFQFDVDWYTKKYHPKANSSKIIETNNLWREKMAKGQTLVRQPPEGLKLKQKPGGNGNLFLSSFFLVDNLTPFFLKRLVGICRFHLFLFLSFFPSFQVLLLAVPFLLFSSLLIKLFLLYKDLRLPMCH